jgi:hypothetical protein
VRFILTGVLSLLLKSFKWQLNTSVIETRRLVKGGKCPGIIKMCEYCSQALFEFVLAQTIFKYDAFLQAHFD